MSIFVEAKAVMHQTNSSRNRIDPLLALDPTTAAALRNSKIPSALRSPLQTLQRRLGLRIEPDARELGLPPEMAGLISNDVSPGVIVTSLLTASRIFDAAFYLAQSPASLVARRHSLWHFVTNGWRQGLSPNFYFDPSFYGLQTGTTNLESVNPLLHYLYVGEGAGMRPSRHFDPVWYRTHYGLTEQSAFCHFLRHIEERRFSPNPEFDVEHYLRLYPDVREDGCDPLCHYLAFGQDEGRQPLARVVVHPSNAVVATVVQPEWDSAAAEEMPLTANADLELAADIRTLLASNLLDVDWYRRRADVQVADATCLAQHYLANKSGVRVSPNPLFDVEFYRQRYGDAISGTDPFIHYLRGGWRQNFDPHPLFSVQYYLDHNSDVRSMDQEPLAHYVTTGCKEGRSTCEEFDARYYLKENSDVAEHNCDPLRHYIDFGAAEGRNPSPTFETLWYAQHVLEGRPDNPLIHFRLSGESAETVFVRKISLSSTYEMSDLDFRLWTRAFVDVDKELARSADNIALVRVSPAQPEIAAAKTRDRSLEDVVAALRSTSGKPPDAVYLFCEPSDEIDSRLMPRLVERVTKSGGLAIFDFACRHGEFWVPMLLPGANAAHLEAVDATFSRFAISGRLLAEITIPDHPSAYDVMRAALAHLRAEGRLDRFTHTPAPILRTRDLSDELRAKQLKLAQCAMTTKRPKPSRRAVSSISVVICTKDRCRLLSQLVDSLLAFDAALVPEIIIVANPAEDSFAQTHPCPLRDEEARHRLTARWTVQFLATEQPRRGAMFRRPAALPQRRHRADKPELVAGASRAVRQSQSRRHRPSPPLSRREKPARRDVSRFQGLCGPYDARGAPAG